MYDSLEVICEIITDKNQYNFKHIYLGCWDLN